MLAATGHTLDEPQVDADQPALQALVPAGGSFSSGPVSRKSRGAAR